MRTLVEELEAAKRQLLAETTAATPPPPPQSRVRFDKENTGAATNSPPRHTKSLPVSLSPSKPARADFVALTEQLERLRLEHAALVQELRERDLFPSALQHLLVGIRSSHALTLTHDAVQSAVAAALEQCRAARVAYEAKRQLLVSDGRCFGWTDFRVRTGRTIAFAVQKQFKNTRAAALRDSVWDFATDSTRIARLLPPGLTCDLRLVQRVSSNVLVVDRCTYATPGTFALRTLLLVFRVRDDVDGSEVLVMKTLDAPLVQALLAPHELWCDVFYWMRFQDAEDEEDGTLSEFGGELSYVREDIASAWVAELLFLAVRWETLAVRPVLLTAA